LEGELIQIMKGCKT